MFDSMSDARCAARDQGTATAVAVPTRPRRTALRRLCALAACLAGASLAPAGSAQPTAPPSKSTPSASTAASTTRAADAASPSASAVAPLPAPPADFQWRRLNGVVVLVPRGWLELEKRNPDATPPHETYAASPEPEFPERQFFETGFTVQVIPQASRSGLDARQTATAYLLPFAQPRKQGEVLLFEQTEREGVQYTFFRYLDAPEGLTPITVHKLVMADNARDVVHAFTFESPTQAWAQNWERYGTPILSHLQMIREAPAASSPAP